TADSKVKNLVDANGTLYFTADDGVHKPDLFKSDGSEPGTTRIPTPGSATPQELTYGNGHLFFSLGSLGLWRTQGFPGATARGAGPVTFPQDLTMVNDVLFFSAGPGNRELWRSDAFTAKLVKDVNSNSLVGSSPTDLTAVGDVLFFTADDGVHGR